MGFVKTIEEAAGVLSRNPEFYGAEMLVVLWETSPETVRRLLPPPLEPAARPLAMAFVANYPETNFGVSYREAALFLQASFQGEPGSYCLAMPVTDDMALALGRESMGYPKKIADVSLRREGVVVEGWAERKGTRFLELKATLSGTLDNEDALMTMLEVFGTPGADPSVVTAYNFKHFPAPELVSFDYHPRLVQERVEFRPEVMELGRAEVTLRSSLYDPWAEIEVVKVLGAVYTKGHNTMLPGQVVAEVSPEEFLPYAFLKWDL
ncbi:MAG: acetoacetate decarboxylase family protein [Thermodesulfobacteriota bacterium]